MRTGALWTTQKEALPTEMVSLSERLSLMFLVRVAIVAVALTSALFGVEVHGGGMIVLAILSAGYITLSVVSEGLRRVSGGRGLVIIGIMLLVDGVCLAWITYATGGAHSPLRFLLYSHLIAVTLLASFRTGLKIALWHSLLVFVFFYSQLAGFITPVEVTEGTTAIAQSPFHRTSVLNLMAFWFIAIATAGFSALNEKNLRRPRIRPRGLGQDGGPDGRGHDRKRCCSLPRRRCVRDLLVRASGGDRDRRGGT